MVMYFILFPPLLDNVPEGSRQGSFLVEKRGEPSGDDRKTENVRR
jgi:hypothetical protein